MTFVWERKLERERRNSDRVNVRKLSMAEALQGKRDEDGTHNRGNMYNSMVKLRVSREWVKPSSKGQQKGEKMMWYGLGLYVRRGT